MADQVGEYEGIVGIDLGYVGVRFQHTVDRVAVSHCYDCCLFRHSTLYFFGSDRLPVFYLGGNRKEKGKYR